MNTREREPGGSRLAVVRQNSSADRERNLEGPGDREINAAAVLAGGRLLAVGDGPSPDNDANPEQDARVWIATPQR